MPLLVNGFGTRFYGKCHGHEDDSHVTTEWVVAFYFPIAPTRSLRVIRDSSRDGSLLGMHSYAYDILDEYPIYWPQVRRVYLFTVFLVLWYFGVLKLGLHWMEDSTRPESIIGTISYFALIPIPWLYLWWHRWCYGKASEVTGTLSSEPRGKDRRFEKLIFKQFLLKRGSAISGPFALYDVKRMLDQGDLTSTDLCRFDDMQDWVSISEMLPEIKKQTA
jgi:hypothetical protein